MSTRKETAGRVPWAGGQGFSCSAVAIRDVVLHQPPKTPGRVWDPATDNGMDQQPL